MSSVWVLVGKTHAAAAAAVYGKFLINHKSWHQSHPSISLGAFRVQRQQVVFYAIAAAPQPQPQSFISFLLSCFRFSTKI